jgi:hypothetical protein
MIFRGINIILQCGKRPISSPYLLIVYEEEVKDILRFVREMFKPVVENI